MEDCQVISKKFTFILTPDIVVIHISQFYLFQFQYYNFTVLKCKTLEKLQFVASCVLSKIHRTVTKNICLTTLANIQQHVFKTSTKFQIKLVWTSTAVTYNKT